MIGRWTKLPSPERRGVPKAGRLQVDIRLMFWPLCHSCGSRNPGQRSKRLLDTRFREYDKKDVILSRAGS